MAPSKTVHYIGVVYVFGVLCQTVNTYSEIKVEYESGDKKNYQTEHHYTLDPPTLDVTEEWGKNHVEFVTEGFKATKKTEGSSDENLLQWIENKPANVEPINLKRYPRQIHSGYPSLPTNPTNYDPYKYNNFTKSHVQSQNHTWNATSSTPYNYYSSISQPGNSNFSISGRNPYQSYNSQYPTQNGMNPYYPQHNNNIAPNNSMYAYNRPHINNTVNTQLPQPTKSVHPGANIYNYSNPGYPQVTNRPFYPISRSNDMNSSRPIYPGTPNNGMNFTRPLYSGVTNHSMIHSYPPSSSSRPYYSEAFNNQTYPNSRPFNQRASMNSSYPQQIYPGAINNNYTNSNYPQPTYKPLYTGAPSNSVNSSRTFSHTPIDRTNSTRPFYQGVTNHSMIHSYPPSSSSRPYYSGALNNQTHPNGRSFNQGASINISSYPQQPNFHNISKNSPRPPNNMTSFQTSNPQIYPPHSQNYNSTHGKISGFQPFFYNNSNSYNSWDQGSQDYKRNPQFRPYNNTQNFSHLPNGQYSQSNNSYLGFPSKQWNNPSPSSFQHAGSEQSNFFYPPQPNTGSNYDPRKNPLKQF